MTRNLSTRTRALIAATVLAVAGAVGTGTAVAAPTTLPACSKGYNNANTAWFTCTGSGTWQGYANCYFYAGQQTSWITQSGGTVHEWLTCPSPSHVTTIGFNP